MYRTYIVIVLKNWKHSVIANLKDIIKLVIPYIMVKLFLMRPNKITCDVHNITVFHCCCLFRQIILPYLGVYFYIFILPEKSIRCMCNTVILFIHITFRYEYTYVHTHTHTHTHIHTHIYIYIYIYIYISVTLHFEASCRMVHEMSITAVICCILARFKLGVWTP